MDRLQGWDWVGWGWGEVIPYPLFHHEIFLVYFTANQGGYFSLQVLSLETFSTDGQSKKLKLKKMKVQLAN